MARAANGVYTASGTAFEVATADLDGFDAGDVQLLAAAVRDHTHESTRGLAIKRVQSGTFAARPAAGNAGHVYVATDTGILYVDTGAAWVEAYTPNSSIFGAWTAWTPTLTQGVAVTHTATARYAALGKIAHVFAFFQITSSGTSGARIEIGGVPAAIQPKYPSSALLNMSGGAAVYPGSGNVRTGLVAAYSASTLSFMVDNAGANWMGVTPSLQLISGGTIALFTQWEIN